MSNNAQRIIKKVFDDLYDRGGFDHWWDDIDSDIQQEILGALVRHVETILAEPS